VDKILKKLVTKKRYYPWSWFFRKPVKRGTAKASA